jgi:hypothetical protein
VLRPSATTNSPVLRHSSERLAAFGGLSLSSFGSGADPKGSSNQAYVSSGSCLSPLDRSDAAAAHTFEDETLRLPPDPTRHDNRGLAGVPGRQRSVTVEQET